MVKLNLSHELLGEHTITLVVVAGEQNTILFSSLSSDGYGDLVRNAVVLLEGAEISEFTWADEGVATDWLLERDGDTLHIQISWLDRQTTAGRRMNPVRETLLEARCDLLRFAIQVKGQLQQLLNELGAEGYLTRLYHPFPFVEFDGLKRLINERKEQRQ